MDNREDIDRAAVNLARGEKVRHDELREGDVIMGAGEVTYVHVYNGGQRCKLTIQGIGTHIHRCDVSVTIEPRGLDMSAHYSVAGYEGIAFYLIGYVERLPECEGHPTDDDPELYPHAAIGDTAWCDGSCQTETVEDHEWVRAVMVGDDRVFEIEVSDLTVIDEDDYCAECGQIGCGHDGRER